ncbi:hypothetical protein CYMTET_18260 [Cymbomonas tetramitiformis]|uniref:Uncharacterized protein n=1 Tax=Cymbomonas tetramitiformis TaxID=36881 RepID=A0AAE0G8C6_9CHLO|nr:hypothetical protein CYMTET_18260 [Cymbomonas tetramitiformis]
MKEEERKAKLREKFQKRNEDSGDTGFDSVDPQSTAKSTDTSQKPPTEPETESDKVPDVVPWKRFQLSGAALLPRGGVGHSEHCGK